MELDWTGLNQMDAESGAGELRQVAQEMAKQLEARPQSRSILMDLFGRHLDGPITPETYTPLWEAVETYFGLGDDPPQLLAWLLQGDVRERLTALVAQAPQELGSFLRELLTLYGQPLQQAYRRWREIPDNWEWMQRETYFDFDRNRHRLDLTILKFNGETVRLSMDARSVLLMAARLMGSLSLAASDPFTEAELDNLRQETDGFWRAVEMSREQEADAAAPAPADPAQPAA